MFDIIDMWSFLMHFQESFIAYAFIVLTALLLASAILHFGKHWPADTSEVCIVSFGSFVGQGMNDLHLSNISSRVSME